MGWGGRGAELRREHIPPSSGRAFPWGPLGGSTPTSATLAHAPPAAISAGQLSLRMHPLTRLRPRAPPTLPVPVPGSRTCPPLLAQTVNAALEIIGAIGLESPAELRPQHVFMRVSSTKVLSYEQQYPSIQVRSPASRAQARTQRARAAAHGPPPLCPPCRLRVCRRRAHCSPAGPTRALRCRSGTRRGGCT
jgi:hypothetical protein